MSEGQEAAHAEQDLSHLERARVAAMSFCHRFGFSDGYLDQLNGSPIQEPLVIDRDGISVEVFRWLGHGRGEAYVQVELKKENDEVTVYGGFDHREFGPWEAVKDQREKPS